MRPTTRRRFLKQSGLTAAGAALAVAGASSSALGANDRINLGVIGLSRGQSLCGAFAAQDDARLAYVCDTDRQLCVGPCLFLDGTWQGVCQNCARQHAPGLLAVLNSPEVQTMYWTAERDAEAQRAKSEHEDRLAARVIREARNKLTTGLKNPRRK